MDWKEWIGKYVFIKTLSGAVYSGIVRDVDDNAFPLIFITITDKFGEMVTITHSEIIKIKEERKNERYS